MGPHSFERGNLQPLGINGQSCCRLRFNGASLFRARKHTTISRSHSHDNNFPASMGPHSFERGNDELRQKLLLEILPTRASMGPHSFERGNRFFHYGARKLRSPITLQWGLTLSSEETSKYYKAVYFNWGSACFNGASLFRARKLRTYLEGLTDIAPVASMGPHSFERGNLGCRGTGLPRPR